MFIYHWFYRIFILCGYPEEFFIIPVILCFTVVSYKIVKRKHSAKTDYKNLIYRI